MMKIENQTVREFIAEALGTFVLTTLGCSANAYATVTNVGNMGHTIGPWAWGMALTASIYVCGGVSGGHVNPAVTFGMAVIGKLPFHKVLHYVVAQFIGAFFGAVIAFSVYANALYDKFGSLEVEGEKGTSGIFGTLPTAGISNGICFLDQLVACSFFLLLINAITDKRNMDCPKGLIPIAIGVTDLGLMIFSFGYNCGAPINPARDLAPRIVSAMVGYGGGVFSAGNVYFWVPLIACPLGGALGSIIYKLLIEMHWPSSEDADEKSEYLVARTMTVTTEQ